MTGKSVEELIQRAALQNAVQHSGKARTTAVLGKILAERPDQKKHVRTLIKTIETIVKDINDLPTSRQKELLDEIWPEAARPEVKPEGKKLPALPNVEKYHTIHVRFCPNPDGALHLGGARAAILDDEYAKMYNGRFTLRFDDTDPRTKSPIFEAYDWIVKDLEWLGVEWHNTVYQSDRLELYYSYTKQLIEMGAAYVCTCKTAEFRKMVLSNRPCPCRNLPPEEHLKRWNMMLEGAFIKGEAVVRVKTDLNHPNPAVREWPALRVIDTNKFPHPRTKNKYRVWPLFAFCCGIDDHDLGISHVIRGKEHLTNSVRQLFLFNYLNWDPPEAIHYGRLKIPGSVLSKSKIREDIAKGVYRGWDDPRLGTLVALRRRGFLPGTIRQVIREVGPKPVDATISLDNVQAINRKLLDPIANRYFFVADPIKLVVKNVGKVFISKLLLHPDDPNRGRRNIKVEPKDGSAHLLISKHDLRSLRSEGTVRLMGLFNIYVEDIGDHVEAGFRSEEYNEARRVNAPLIHWIPDGTGIPTSVTMSDASKLNGLAEHLCRTLKPGEIIQFQRFGFVRVDTVTDDKIDVYYAHR